eukprot:12023155-Alexandrium_andersonii.AAC.1
MTGVRPPVPLRFGVEGGGSGGSPPPDLGAAEAVPPESVAAVQKASSAIKWRLVCSVVSFAYLARASK